MDFIDECGFLFSCHCRSQVLLWGVRVCETKKGPGEERGSSPDILRFGVEEDTQREIAAQVSNHFKGTRVDESPCSHRTQNILHFACCVGREGEEGEESGIRSKIQ